MGQSKDGVLRHKIIESRKIPLSYTKISKEYGVGYNTVRSICRRYELRGEEGLAPLTANCGRKVKAESIVAFRLVRLIAHCHPTWGVPYVVLRIGKKFPDLKLQSVRHYQRQFGRNASLVPAATLPKEEVADRARQPHDTWQIDAKERIAQQNNSMGECCFLNITDEKTSALLRAKVFPPSAGQPGSLGRNSPTAA